MKLRNKKGNLMQKDLMQLEKNHKLAMEGIKAFNKEMKGFIEAGKERKYL